MTIQRDRPIERRLAEGIRRQGIRAGKQDQPGHFDATLSDRTVKRRKRAAG